MYELLHGNCIDILRAMPDNGASTTVVKITGTSDRACYFYAYLASPTSGTFVMNFVGLSSFHYALFTVKDAAQINPIDASAVTNAITASQSTSVTTSAGNDLLLSYPWWVNTTWSSFGSGESTLITAAHDVDAGEYAGSYKTGAATAGTETMTINLAASQDVDEPIMAIKYASSTVATSTVYTNYAYAGTNYANPDAVTSIGNGTATTTYLYDTNGNVSQAGIWTYLYDYLNRITSVGGGGSTSTMGYDAFGSRVYQAGTTSTTTYANKFYSIASTSISGTAWATTTSSIWLGDTLLATFDQQSKSGTVTGPVKVQYVHSDHLGSTNVVTDAGDNLIQTLDYYPFGATRIAVATSTNIKRKYIGQFADDQTSLDYFAARYYDSSRGQFVNQDPVSWEIGLTQDGRAALSNPQAQNFYGYANDNPVTNKDPSGRLGALAAAPFLAPTAEIAAGVTLPAWVVPAAIVGGVALSTYAAYSLYQQYGYSEAPSGYYQAVQSVRGSGYSSDPQFNPTPPKNPWKFAAWTAIVSGTGIVALNQFCENLCLPLINNQGVSIHTGTGPVVNLPTIPISTYMYSGSPYWSSPSSHTACGLLCGAPLPTQPATSQPTPTSSNRPTPSSGASGSGSGSRGPTHSACGTLCL